MPLDKNSPVPKENRKWLQETDDKGKLRCKFPSLLEYLDSMKALERKLNAPLMMPISAKYKDLGTMIEGKIESGILKKEASYLLMPTRQVVTISALYGETEDEISVATCGDQVRIRIRGVEENEVLPGFVLCSPQRPVHNVSAFEAQIKILPELPAILSAGFNCVMHVHTATEEMTFGALICKVRPRKDNPKEIQKTRTIPPFVRKGESLIARLEVTGGAGSICVETFEDYPQLGRFTLRDQVRRKYAGQRDGVGRFD